MGFLSLNEPTVGKWPSLLLEDEKSRVKFTLYYYFYNFFIPIFFVTFFSLQSNVLFFPLVSLFSSFFFLFLSSYSFLSSHYLLLHHHTIFKIILKIVPCCLNILSSMYKLNQLLY